MFFAWIKVSCTISNMSKEAKLFFYTILQYTEVITSKCTWKQNIDFFLFKILLTYASHTQFYEWTIQINYNNIKAYYFGMWFIFKIMNYYHINIYNSKYTTLALPLAGYRGPDCPPALPQWYTVCALSGSSVYWWGPVGGHLTWLEYSTSRLSAPLSPVETIPAFTYFAYNLHVSYKLIWMISEL